jgi:hypothetical protein
MCHTSFGTFPWYLVPCESKWAKATAYRDDNAIVNNMALQKGISAGEVKRLGECSRLSFWPYGKGGLCGMVPSHQGFLEQAWHCSQA